MSHSKLEFGVWFAPFHPTNENPTLSLRREIALVEHLDRLGFDEAWFGEHHSGGWGIVSSPELMIAATAERTSNIRLGTGVISLPYHNPLIVANRMTQLDHMTKGRAIFGFGAGQLPSDAYMLNINPDNLRKRMSESLEVITHLVRNEEPISYSTDWFTLNEARIHLRPYKDLEMAVASLYSPNSMILAGKYNLGTISLGGLLPGDGLVNLPQQWAIAEENANKNGYSMNRENWRLIIPIHLADTREEARKDVREGGYRWLIEYFKNTHGRPVDYDVIRPGYELDAMAEQGGAIIGTVDDCIARIQDLIEKTGGFGKIIAVAQDWASTEKINRSFELIARYVMPKFQGTLKSTEDSRLWLANNKEEFSHKWTMAQKNAKNEFR